MPSLDQIQKEDIQELRIEFVENDPDPLLIDVDMSLMTVGWHRGFKQFEDNDVGGVADHFFGPVKKWNLTGRDKKSLPLNADGLNQLALSTFWEIVSKMGEAATPKRGDLDAIVAAWLEPGIHAVNVRKGFADPLPDYVEIIQAARWWGITPIQMLEMPLFWYEAGQIVQEAESIISRRRQETSKG